MNLVLETADVKPPFNRLDGWPKWEIPLVLAPTNNGEDERWAQNIIGEFHGARC